MNLRWRILGLAHPKALIPLGMVAALAMPVARGAVLDDHGESFGAIAAASGNVSPGRLRVPPDTEASFAIEKGGLDSHATVGLQTDAPSHVAFSSMFEIRDHADESGFGRNHPNPQGHDGLPDLGEGWTGSLHGGWGDGHELDSDDLKVSAVPEPTSSLMTLFGLLAIVVLFKLPIRAGRSVKRG